MLLTDSELCLLAGKHLKSNAAQCLANPTFGQAQLGSGRWVFYKVQLDATQRIARAPAFREPVCVPLWDV